MGFIYALIMAHCYLNFQFGLRVSSSFVECNALDTYFANFFFYFFNIRRALVCLEGHGIAEVEHLYFIVCIFYLILFWFYIASVENRPLELE